MALFRDSNMARVETSKLAFHDICLKSNSHRNNQQFFCSQFSKNSSQKLVATNSELIFMYKDNRNIFEIDYKAPGFKLLLARFLMGVLIKQQILKKMFDIPTRDSRYSLSCLSRITKK